ncbi:TadE family type IV pilus minor pilin [Nocardia sp. NPDC088792]|uniref:TadE family type IV pilus minor pilin n=1 Tax=Nocardia sp. NPDC088792 TaxID=3364332 RepID=UPI003830A7ED
MATVEAALALAAVVAVLVLCIAALLAASAQIRCVDAAREAARLSARGQDAAAVSLALRVAPPGAQVGVRHDADFVTATVSARSPLLPLTLSASAVAAREPGADTP